MKYLDKRFSTPANSKAYVDNWEAVFGEKSVAYNCDVCGLDATDMPWVWPWLWAQIAPGVVSDQDAHEMGCDTRCQCGILCLRCAEARLGRVIGDDDIDTGPTRCDDRGESVSP